jgi:Protein of unknown function (DUF2510)
MTSRTGRSLVLAGIAAVIIAAALFAVGITHVVREVVRTVNAPAVVLPTDIQRDLDAADYDVYQRTGTRSGNGFTFTEDGPVTLTPSDVVVTAPDGSRVPVRLSSGNETLTRGSQIFTSAARFTVSSPGSYDIRIRRPGLGDGIQAADGDQAIVAKSFGSVARSAVRWVVVIILGGMLGLGAIVLFIIAFVRGRRQGTPVAAPAYAAAPVAPPAGWYPDPSGQSAHRWWDGNRWTDHVG